MPRSQQQERTMGMVLRHVSNTASGYVVAWTLGNIIGPVVWVLCILGVIRVRNYTDAIAVMRRGNVIIAANHPSLIETFIIPAIFWPYYLFDPKLFVWSMPDRGLFPRYVRWAYPIIRCVPIERPGAADSKAAKKRKLSSRSRGLRCAKRILLARGTIVIHPEGGRTCKGTDFVRHAGKRIRHIETGVPFLAADTDAAILPLRITMRRSGPNHAKKPLGFGDGIVRLFRRGSIPVVLSFGAHYKVAHPCRIRIENRRLEMAILKS